MTIEEKAIKWDKLEKKINLCYFMDDGSERTMDDSDPEYRDLVDIGELAASAFGYL